MEMISRRTSWLLILCALPAIAQGTLTLVPSSSITVAQGSVSGWGFALSNPGGTWMEITSANLCMGSSGVNTACQPPTTGTFADFISVFNDIVAGPSPDSPTVAQNFNLTAHTGVGSFSVPVGAPTGSAGALQIVLTYNLFSRSPHDPAFDPGADTLATDAVLASPVTVYVGSSTSVPVLGTVGLAVLAILLMAGPLRLGRLAQRT
jgi:hypothetical protein